MNKAQKESKGELVVVKKECKVRHDKITQKIEEMGQMTETKEQINKQMKTKEQWIEEHIVMRERRMRVWKTLK